MEIEEFLKMPELVTRLSCEHNHILFWEARDNTWVVVELHYYEEGDGKQLYKGALLANALEALKKG